METIDRPGMRPYKAKKPPTGQWFDNEETDGSYGVLVFRTHDIERARKLAEQVWRENGYEGPLIPEDVEVRTGWTKLLPWGGDNGHWTSSTVPLPGYIPFVVFEVPS